MDDLYGHTLVSYSAVYINYEEQLWSANCSIVSVGGNRDTKDEVKIRLPNVYIPHYLMCNIPQQCKTST